jgi:hypothetical protein
MASIVKLYRDASFGSSLKRTPMCKSIISAFPNHHLIETVFAFCLVFFSSHMGEMLPVSRIDRTNDHAAS